MSHDKEYVEVSISTTAGFYPDKGFDRTKATEAISEQLEKAAKKLKIKSTVGWVATVNEPSGKRVLEPSRTYVENRVAGEVEIDWGPSEGGGGDGFSAGV
jgi:hypothetical protein